MANIRVVAENNVKAGKNAEFLALAGEIVKLTNELDEGCVSYDLYQDLANPQKYYMLEEWVSQEALTKHTQAAHFGRIIPQLGALCEGGGAPIILTKAL